jgi:hypothetical protein
LNVEGKDASYEVGYGKPPVSTRFTRGQSGNRNGRPKGSENLATIIAQEAKQLVQIHGAGGSRTVTKQRAAVMQLVNKAAQGDLPSLRTLFDELHRSEEPANSNTQPIKHDESNQRTLETMVRRIQRKLRES